MPKKLIGNVIAGHGHEELISIGGMDIHKNLQKYLYKLKCSSGICKWTTLKQKLKVGRSVFVAIPLKDSDFSCK